MRLQQLDSGWHRCPTACDLPGTHMMSRRTWKRARRSARRASSALSTGSEASEGLVALAAISSAISRAAADCCALSCTATVCCAEASRKPALVASSRASRAPTPADSFLLPAAAAAAAAAAGALRFLAGEGLPPLMAEMVRCAAVRVGGQRGCRVHKEGEQPALGAMEQLAAGLQ